jgi:2-dehydro-3-deoxyphosphogluconate aldolase/(4S)-4-hydroxy-2-oxoglutarate aldolase
VTGFPDMLAEQRVLPVIVLDDHAAARPLADTLLDAGMRCLEITLRTAAAIPALELLRDDERMLVGAGKFFPAGPLGGVAAVRALAGPFPAMRLVPTGGVGPDDVAAYLAEPSVPAVGGSWMVRPELVRAHAWGKIGDLARAAVAA